MVHFNLSLIKHGDYPRPRHLFVNFYQSVTHAQRRARVKSRSSIREQVRVCTHALIHLSALVSVTRGARCSCAYCLHQRCTPFPFSTSTLFNDGHLLSDIKTNARQIQKYFFFFTRCQIVESISPYETNLMTLLLIYSHS